jgi:hypothetical protein
MISALHNQLFNTYCRGGLWRKPIDNAVGWLGRAGHIGLQRGVPLDEVEQPNRSDPSIKRDELKGLDASQLGCCLSRAFQSARTE